MGSSIHLESTAVGELAQRIGDARRLYGNDSPYVIGMMTVVEWIAQGAEGGQGLKQDLLARVLESEGKKQPPRALPGTAESSPPPHERRTLAENTWTRGVVKWFNNDKGYGFISTDSHVDVFVHWRDISSNWGQSLNQDDEVEFMVTRTAKGFQAINVMKASQDKAAAETATEPGALDATEEAENVSSDAADGEDSPPNPLDDDGQS